jgi:hypothetical protein
VADERRKAMLKLPLTTGMMKCADNWNLTIQYEMRGQLENEMCPQPENENETRG